MAKLKQGKTVYRGPHRYRGEVPDDIAKELPLSWFDSGSDLAQPVDQVKLPDKPKKKKRATRRSKNGSS